MVAAIAAGTVMLATTTLVPPNPPTAVSAPQISTQAVRLAVQPITLDVAPVADAVSIPSVNVGGAIQHAILQVIAGAGGGAFFGFIAAGSVAAGVFYQIPVVGLAFEPLVPVIAIAGAIVGAPIGAVAAVLSLLPPLPIRIPVAGKKAAAAAPHRSTQASSQSSRHTAKSPAPTVRKASAPQQRSDASRAGSGRDRGAASRNTR
jgi:hypothetical protein